MSSMKYPYRDLGVPLDRNFRNDLNANFDDIEHDIRMIGGEAAQQALEAAEEANTQAIYAQTSGDYAQDKGDYAAQQGDYAQTQGNFANEKGLYAQQQGDYAKEQGDYAKQVGDENKTRWLTAVNTYADIATTYPNPQLGDTVQTIDDSKIYRWDGTQWVWTQQYNANAITDVQNKIGILLKRTAISVKEFGAIGDGFADDTQALKSAYNNCPEGSILFIPRGTYKVRNFGKLVIDKAITIIGEGMRASVIDATEDNTFCFLITTSNVNFVNMGIKKQYDTVGIGNFQPIYITDHRSDTGLTYTCENIRVQNVYIEGGGNCIQVGSNANTTGIHGVIKNVVIEGCELYSNQDGSGNGTCIHGTYGEDCKFINNFCYGGEGASSINLYQIKNSLVQGNSIYNNKWAGIEIEDSQGGNIVANNNIFNCKQGIWVDDSKNDTVYNNTITTNSVNDNAGILITSKSLSDGSLWLENLTIDGNRIIGYKYGISTQYLTPTNHPNAKISKLIITNNKIVGCQHGIIVGDLSLTEPFGYASKVTVKGNYIEYNNSVYATSVKGIWVLKQADDVLIEDNTVKSYAEGITLHYENPSMKIYFINNTVLDTTGTNSIYANTAGTVFVKDNIVDKSIRVTETSYFNDIHQASGNHSLSRQTAINQPIDFISFTPQIRVFQNATGATIEKGSIVRLETGYIQAAQVKKCTTADDPLAFAVAVSDVPNGSYGRFVVSGLCDVKVNGTINAGDILTNNASAEAVVRTSGQRALLVAMEANASGQAVKKAVLLNR